MVTNSDAGSAADPDSTAGAVSALHATVTGSGPRVVLLHGLFGMGSNLGSIARHLARDHEVHQLDLPNHGRSAWTDAHGIPALARAVAAYLESAQGQPAALLGHSLGGKVAMELAMSRPGLVSALVIADIAPVTYQPSHAAVFAAIDAVASAHPASRSDAADIMRRHLREENVVQFLLLSLHRRRGAYEWRFNAEALREGYESLLMAPSAGRYAGPVLLVYGEQSSYVDDEGMAAARQRFPELQLASIAGTGHWLHAERPEEFNRVVGEFLLPQLPPGSGS
jgi:esterase